MKSSDTRASFATTGLGKRFDPEPPMWFLARVSAVTTVGSFSQYTLIEVEPVITDYGYADKPGGVTVTRAQELNNATVAVDTVVIARFRGWNDDGETYEFTSGGGSSPLTVYEWITYATPPTPHLQLPAFSSCYGTAIFNIAINSGGVSEYGVQAYLYAGSTVQPSILPAHYYKGSIVESTHVILACSFLFINSTASNLEIIPDVFEVYSHPPGSYIEPVVQRVTYTYSLTV